MTWTDGAIALGVLFVTISVLSLAVAAFVQAIERVVR